jgi:hypothetical protein
MNLPVGAENAEAQRALALTEGTIQGNQRRYCSLIYLAGVLDKADNAPAGYDNSIVNPCQ